MHLTQIKSKAGFTLVELIIVLAIISIMAAIAIPNYIRQQPFRQLNTTGRDIYANMQLAKAEAVRRNSNVAMEFIPGPAPAPRFTSYRVFLDNGNGGGVAGDSIRQANEQILVQPVTLPLGIMGTHTFAVNAVGFSSRGLATGLGTVTLNIDVDANGVADVIGGQTPFRAITVSPAGAVRFDDRTGRR